MRASRSEKIQDLSQIMVQQWRIDKPPLHHLTLARKLGLQSHTSTWRIVVTGAREALFNSRGLLLANLLWSPTLRAEYPEFHARHNSGYALTEDHRVFKEFSRMSYTKAVSGLDKLDTAVSFEHLAAPVPDEGQRADQEITRNCLRESREWLESTGFGL